MNTESGAGPAGFPERLRQCVEKAGGGNELARRAGMPRRTLENYLAGRNEPKIGAAVDIARAADVSLEWLLTGSGQPRGATEIAVIPSDKSPLDEDLLRDVVIAVETVLDERDLRPAPKRKAELLIAVYNLEREKAGTTRQPVDRTNLIRLVRIAS